MWEPISTGEQAARVWHVLAELEDALAACDAPAADLAVFWTYIASVRDDDTSAARAAEASRRFVAELDRGYAVPALFEGLAGAGWAAAHVASDAQRLLDVIDARLVELLGAWHGELDLISGVAGFAVYFLARDGATAERGLELAVERLADAAERGESGATWHTPPHLLAEIDRVRWPTGAYDCGVAHGTAGIAGVLARVAARPGAPAVAAELAAEATRWLLAQRRAGELPALVAGDWQAARTGWCYGAPGTALALGGREDLARWIDQPAHVDGDGLCHGAAALLHAANRMYQATRRDAYRDAARVWLDRLLAARRPGEGVAGFGYLERGERRAAILSGAAGVGLALLAAVSELEPAWDRVMLCDLPVL